MFKFLARKYVYLALALFTVMMAAPNVPAQDQRDMRKEAEIWKELAAIAPDSVETFKRATEAIDKGDTTEAIRRYGEVMIEAPEWDVIHRRLGVSLMVSGQTKEGLEMLRKAVELNVHRRISSRWRR
jgi:predicted TPR repeat methyltransferase